jgi:hypothetical protein
MIPRKTNQQPHIYYANSEDDYSFGKETNCPGLSAGYINTKNLPNEQRGIWESVFNLMWDKTCLSFANQLSELGVDSFTIVPCSRLEVVEGIKNGFLNAGLIEVPNVITKRSSKVSYASKDSNYIANNSEINYNLIQQNKIEKIAVCDDYSDTGKTLRGLYEAMVLANEVNIHCEVFLCSIGISKILINENE